MQVDLKVISVADSNTKFLQYLDKVGIAIGSRLQILDKVEYDGSLEISIGQKGIRLISQQVSTNILVTQ